MPSTSPIISPPLYPLPSLRRGESAKPGGEESRQSREERRVGKAGRRVGKAGRRGGGRRSSIPQPSSLFKERRGGRWVKGVDRIKGDNRSWSKTRLSIFYYNQPEVERTRSSFFYLRPGPEVEERGSPVGYAVLLPLPLSFFYLRQD